MKRILFFNDSLALGGTEILLVNLLNHLVTKETKITLLLPEESGSDVFLLKKLSSEVTVKYIYPNKTSYLKRKLQENIMIFFPRFFARLKGINESDYDEVVCFKETFFATVFSRMSIPKILWIHNILYKRSYEIRSFKERFAVWLNKKHLKKVQRSYDRFNKVICVSDAAKKAYLSVLHGGHMPAQDIQVLYNAIDLSTVAKKAKEPIEDLPQGITNFILITRNSPEKRIDRLINAAHLLKEEGYELHVYIIGEGIDNTDMINNLNIKNITNDVILLGRVENPFPYILQCNWSLCVSERESFSLSLLESMALNTQVITTDCGGPRDIVEGGTYGLLVDNSGEGVYKGMKAVLDNPSLSLKYSKNLDKAVSRYDYGGWLNSVDKLLGV
ncbi:MAG: glycosyltransferase [Prevotella sp.]|jgi:glycosyltransferase involved in cell wall biosynthesis|nr:glycosyltransferase [Prevotella sp.]